MHLHWFASESVLHSASFHFLYNLLYLSHFHKLTWGKTHITDLLQRVNLFLTSVFWNSPAEFFIKHPLLCSHFDVKCYHCFQSTAPCFPSRHTVFLFVLFLTKEACFLEHINISRKIEQKVWRISTYSPPNLAEFPLLSTPVYCLQLIDKYWYIIKDHSLY